MVFDGGQTRDLPAPRLYLTYFMIQKEHGGIICHIGMTSKIAFSFLGNLNVIYTPEKITNVQLLNYKFDNVS
jgi:hypothetical protein